MVLEKSDQKILLLISEAVDMFKLQAEEKNITLQLDVQADLQNDDNIGEGRLLSLIEEADMVYVDKYKTIQVIGNLISNALKFTEDGETVVVKVRKSSERLPVKKPEEGVVQANSSPKILGGVTSTLSTVSDNEAALEISDVENQVTSSADTSEDCIGTLIISVIDSGVGMAPEDFQRLFNEIVQFNPGKLQAGGGSGLGMMITKGIVDLHGGEISAHSDGIGHGSSFTVKLPLYARQSSPYMANGYQSLINPSMPVDATDFIPCEAKIESVHTTSLHFLIVDDSRLNRKMLNKLLVDEDGFTCEEVDDGDKAVEMMKTVDSRRRFDVILMDFMMPNMNGPDATKAIRALGYTGLMLGVTGNAMEKDIQTFISSGVNEVLVKPLDMDKLKYLLTKYVNEKADSGFKT